MSIKKRRGNTLAHEAHGFLRERRRHGRTLRKRFLRMHNGICPGLCDEHRILQYLFSPKEPVQLPRTCGYGRGSYKAPHLRHQSRVHVSHRMAAASHSMVRVFSFTGVLHRTGAPNSPDAMPPCDAGSYRRDAIGGMLPEHISRGRTPPPRVHTLRRRGRSLPLGTQHPVLQSIGVHHGFARLTHGHIYRIGVGLDGTEKCARLDIREGAPPIPSTVSDAAGGIRRPVERVLKDHDD